jgi:hypothetical protein
MKFYEMESIKMILGLPANAGARQIEARLSELLAKEEELEGLKGESGQIKESAKGWSWWRRRS